MHTSPALLRFLRDRGNRSLLAAFGLTVYGLGTYLQIQACIGLSPWNALSQGLADQMGWSFGNASILISLLVIALDLLLREPIGIGTILDALVVGWSTDFFLWAGWVPEAGHLPAQLFLMLSGLVITFVGAYFYMKQGLSCGPRDAMMVALGKRLPRVSIGVIQILILAVVLVASILLGEAPGLGTVITVLGNGAIMDLVFRLLRFEPRSVAHESLLQTWRALQSAGREEAPPQPEPLKKTGGI